MEIEGGVLDLKLRKVSLFSGIEAFDKALKNIGIEVELLALSEIDEYATTSCCAIHDYTETLNLGSVTDIIGDEFTDIDLLTHGSPCQSFSNEGKKEGGEKGSGTKSSLLWETVRIVEKCKPKIVIWENVATVVNKRNKPVFDQYLVEMELLGYTNHYKILRAIDYDLPQNRKRMITISIRNDIHKKFEFPKPIPQTIKLKDLLQSNVNRKYDVPKSVTDVLLLGEHNGEAKIKNGTKLGYLYANENDGIDFGFHNSKNRRGRVQKERSQTLLTGKTLGTYQDGRLRYFTPLEYWLLQGFTSDDYNKARKALKDHHNLSEEGLDTQLYKQAGNSIPVKMLEEVFKELYKEELNN